MALEWSPAREERSERESGVIQIEGGRKTDTVAHSQSMETPYGPNFIAVSLCTWLLKSFFSSPRRGRGKLSADISLVGFRPEGLLGVLLRMKICIQWLILVFYDGRVNFHHSGLSFSHSHSIISGFQRAASVLDTEKCAVSVCEMFELQWNQVAWKERRGVESVTASDLLNR